MNKDTEYELLVQEIYQTLSNEDKSHLINVQHNIKIRGKSGQEHQIDVFYEFSFMGEKHRVVIECKNYTKPISIGKIRDFYGVLQDIGDVKGIFVAKSGFQKGAKQFAEHYGIVLKELRYPTAQDWKGRVKDIIFTISVFTAHVTSREFIFDNDWISKKFGNNQFHVRIAALNSDVKIIDDAGNVLTTLYDLENKLVSLDHEAEEGLTKEYTYDNAFLLIPEQEPLKIKAIKYTYDALISSEEFAIKGDTLAKAIMIDVFSGDSRFFRKEP